MGSAPQNGARALLFCSDGGPNCPGAASELAQITNANWQSFPIHTVQLGGTGPVSFLVDLAAQNNGTFLDINNPPTDFFLRGDADDNGSVNLADAILVLDYLYTGGGAPSCLDAADIDASLHVNLGDPVYLLSYLFVGGPPPPSPSPTTGCSPVAISAPLGPCIQSACP